MITQMKAVSNIISFLSMLFMLWFPLQLLAQEPEYKKWDNHDVKGVYIEVEDEDDADIEEMVDTFKNIAV